MFYTVKKNKNKIFSTIVFLAVLLSPFANTNAAINKVINYQGKLTNLSGVAVTDGTYNMEFKLYNASSTLLWTETRTGSDRVQVTSGIFSVLLGEVTALTSVDFNQTLYLGVNIGETADTPSWDGEMSPLKEIGTVPSAIVAESVLNILGGVAGSIPYQTATNTTSFASNLFWDETNSRLGIGTISPTQVLDINGKIAVNGTQVLYLPDQTSFPGTLYVGNGGDSLAHVGRSLGTNDVFVGINAGYSNTGGSRNIGIGTNSLYLNTTGNENIGIGYQTLNSNTTGGFNIAIGSGALNSNTTGGSNTVNGAESLRYLSSGSHNLALGYFAGSVIANGSTTLTTSNNSLFIGTYTKALTDTSTNEIVIGYDTTGLGSNTVVLGNSSITTTALRGNVGIGTTSPTAALHLPAGTATAETSPLKFTSGILLATPESGAIEYDGTHYYATIGNTRYQIDQQSSGGMVYPGTGIAVSTGSAWGTSISGTSSQFIKGDGSLDSNTYLTTTSAASTYVPYTGATTGVDLGSNILTTTGTGTFGNIIDSGLTSGYLPYANSSKQLTDSVIYTDGTNVGIGTTSPQNELHIFDSVNDNAFIQLGQSSTGSSSIDGFLIGVNGYERAIVWNYEDTDLRFGTNNLDRMTISNNGNIGIGTTSPTARLHLAAGTSTASTAPLKFSSGTNLSTAEAGAMEFDGTQLYFSPADSDRNILLQNSTATAFSTGSISFATDNGYLTEDNSNFYWENTNNRLGIGTNSFYSDIGSGEIPKVLVANPSDPTKIIGVGYSNTWDSGYLYASDQGDSWKNILLNPLGTGKVGINLTNPGVPLDVKGNARLGVGAATSDDYGSALYYSVDASQLNVASVIMKEHVTDNYGLEFQTYGSSSLTTKMTILGTGRVGIGTDSPTAFLHLTAGTADGGRAPLKFTSGTNLATAEAGAMEYDGTQLYFSPSTTRNILAQVSGSTALTTGSIPFATTSGYLTEDNTNFFWDDTNNRLGIGTASPLSALDVKGTLTLSGATSGYVAFAPAADAGSTTYTLPSADGLADQALTTNGSGTMAWNNISKLAQDFTVATGESITAGDVVSFINGQVKKGISATSVSIGNGASSIEYAFNSASTTYISSSTLDSTHFVVVYRDSTGYGTAIVGTVSGTTISYGSEYVFNSASTTSISVSILDSTHFVVAYQDSTGYGTAIVGTVSGTTISYGSEYVFNSAPTLHISATILDSTHFVVAYRDNGNSDFGTAIVGTVSGTTISYGSEYVFNPASTYYISLQILDPTHFIATYIDNGNSDYGTLILGTINSTTITYGSEYVFNSASTFYNSVILLGLNFVVAYQNSTDTRGQSLLGQYSPNTSFIGIAQTSGSSTQTIKVAIQGISNIHSGLTAGNKYYVNSSGNLTTTTSSYRAGIAISSTQLLMNSYSGNSDQFFGDMIFANDFRITEGWSYPNSLIFKNQLGRDILAIDETGTLLTDNLTIGGTKLTVNSFGNVGIGTTATSALKLDVVGSSRFSGSGSSIITGSIDPIADSATVTGVGTLFTTQLAVGDRITVSGETRTVVSIVSDTELTVDTSFTDTENDLEIEKLSAIFIVQNSLGNIKTIINDLGYVGIGTNNPSSIFEIGSSDLGDGLAGPIITLGRNTNITNPGAGSINFLNKNGGAGYVWQDVAGNLRINTVAPTSINDTSGIIVGAQTSTRETKQEINDFTDYSGALTKILNAPLHTFRYINEVEGYGEDSPLAKIRLGFIADEVDSDFMVGNVIDQVSVNGLLIASIKQLSFQMQDIVTNVLGQYAKSFFSEVLVKVENGVGYMKALAIETLRIGSAENPTGITLYDETNGNPYCFSIYDGQTKTMLGECSTTTEEIETEEETDTELASSDDLPDGSPIVTLDGEKVVSLDVGSTYTEAGALATDDIDGEVAVIISGSVDTATTGTYTVTYTATDSAGNTTTVERTITVGTTTTTTDTATESDTSTESESDTTTTDTSTETDATTETESATTTTDTSTGTDTTTDATTQTTTTTNTTTESDTTTETTNTETESDTTTETESSATESESESSSESSTDTASA